MTGTVEKKEKITDLVRELIEAYEEYGEDPSSEKRRKVMELNGIIKKKKINRKQSNALNRAHDKVSRKIGLRQLEMANKPKPLTVTKRRK